MMFSDWISLISLFISLLTIIINFIFYNKNKTTKFNRLLLDDELKNKFFPELVSILVKILKNEKLTIYDYKMWDASWNDNFDNLSIISVTGKHYINIKETITIIDETLVIISNMGCTEARKEVFVKNVKDLFKYLKKEYIY